MLFRSTEPYGPDGQYGKYLSYLLVMLQLAWLALSAVLPHRSAPGAFTGGAIIGALGGLIGLDGAE